MVIRSLGKNSGVGYKAVWGRTGYGAALQWEAPGWYGERACFGGGYNGSSDLNEIDYVAIMTIGNASDFGNLTNTRQYIAGTSNGTRGMFMGGGNASGTPYAITDYITVATTGNATDFGDNTQARFGFGGCNNQTRGIWGGGKRSSGATDRMDYATIATVGNATDFADLTQVKQGTSACAGA